MTARSRASTNARPAIRSGVFRPPREAREAEAAAALSFRPLSLESLWPSSTPPPSPITVRRDCAVPPMQYVQSDRMACSRCLTTNEFGITLSQRSGGDGAFARLSDRKQAPDLRFCAGGSGSEAMRSGGGSWHQLHTLGQAETPWKARTSSGCWPVERSSM